MDIKRKLNEESEKSLQQFENDAFFNQMMQHYDSVQTVRRKKPVKKQVWFSLASAVVTAIIVIVCCVTLLPSATDVGGINPPKHYNVQDEARTACSINEINNYIDTRISFNDIGCVACKKYDKPSGDILSFMLEYETLAENFMCEVFVNEAYDYKWNEENADKSLIIKGHEIKYTELIQPDVDGYSYLNKAYITTDCEKIYIEYTGVGTQPNSDKFISLLEDFIL